VRAAPLLGIALTAAAFVCAESAGRRSAAQPAEAAPPAVNAQGYGAAREQDAAHEPDSADVRPPDPGSTLPDEPTKGLVLAYCDHCHGLEWIERSGANLEGWTSRLRRMNRAGAMIPEEYIGPLADYLARALPERPRPPEPPKKRERHSSTRH
jgi:hypothetical protein